MNVVLVMPRSERVPTIRTEYSPPLGLMSIGATVRHYIPDARLTILNGETVDEEALLTKILNLHPSIVGLTTNVGCYRSALHIAKKIKTADSSVQIVLGGPYVSSMWRESLSNRSYIDCCVVGDGEFPIRDMLGSKPLSEIPGVASRRTDGPYLCAPEDPDLDAYPDPDWSLIDPKPYQQAYRDVYGRHDATLGSINALKGCKWRENTGGCVFCGLVRPRFRQRSPKRVWKEIMGLSDAYGCNYFCELSDTICADVNWLEELAREKPTGSSFHFHTYSRSSEITERTAKLLRQIGVEEIFIGMESGDDNMLRAAHKGTTSKINLRATQLLHAENIRTFGSFILGLPGETRESLEATFKHVVALKASGLSTISPCILTPYPGSEIFNNFVAKHSEYSGKDEFDWPSFRKAWIEENCTCTMDDIMEYSVKLTTIDGGHFEDNFTYVEREYDI